MENCGTVDKVHEMIMGLSDDECRVLLHAWRVHKENPELTPDECVKKAIAAMPMKEVPV